MDKFWHDQQGSTPPTNWFKEHPKATLLLLLIAAGVIVVLSL